MDIELPADLENLDAATLRALLVQSQSSQRQYQAQLAREQQRYQTQIEHQQQVLADKDALLSRKDKDLHHKTVTIDQLNHEIAVLRRFRFGKKSEQLSGVQLSLLEEAVSADIAAIEQELEALSPTAQRNPAPRSHPGRQRLPEALPRIDIHHEPHDITCSCGCQRKRIGEDITEKLDYIPGVARVERHIRGKWACHQCDTLTQAPVPAHVIDKGLATTGLLAHVLVAKYADHLPLYRQQKIFERSGIKLASSTLADWVGVCGVRLQPLVDALRETVLQRAVLHADETPIQVLRPDTGKKTHRAYLWAYAPGLFDTLKAVIYDFAPSRSGEHARAFLGKWRGSLVTDGYSGYKQTFTQEGITEIGCLAHARRKFFDLHAANQRQIAAQALNYIGELYEIERQAKDLDADSRWRIRQQQARPIADKLHVWLQAQRLRVPDGSGTA